MTLRTCPIDQTALAGALALALAAACGSTGPTVFELPLRAHGAAPAAIQAGDWTVTLTRAELAFGPLYLCATAAASADLCEAAVAEFTAVAPVDALDPADQELGDLAVLPGEIRSAMFDYGVTWLPTESRPTAHDGAPGGRSARFAGTAVLGDISLEFTADLDLDPLRRGTRAVEGLRLAPHRPDAGDRLDLDFEVAAWWAGVDFDALAALGPGPLDLDVLADQGGPDSPAAAALDAVRFAMLAAPPRLTWSPEE